MLHGREGELKIFFGFELIDDGDEVVRAVPERLDMVNEDEADGGQKELQPDLG